MAKQLGEVRLLVFGDENGPNTARFEYVVTHSDDSSLTKHAALSVDTPVFDVDTINDFYDGYVDVIKTNEGIS
jgi:hypothetical protein